MSSVWDGIAYDPVASEELSYQLGAMAAALGESLAAVTDEETRVTDGWHGAYRGTFDGEVADCRFVLTALIEGVLVAVATVEAALAAAMAEQAIRVSARLRLEDVGILEPPAEPTRPATGGY